MGPQRTLDGTFRILRNAPSHRIMYTKYIPNMLTFAIYAYVCLLKGFVLNRFKPL